MSAEKPFRICWTAENARSVFRTEALEGNDAVFLATHSPFKGFDVAGRDQGEFEDQTEQAVLHTLSDQDRQHAFCVVQGEPGSGKSHLIRWLSVKWPHQNDLKLLLRRSDGSLEGALRQLREKLGAEYDDLFQNLGVRQRASTQGRANNFLATLANSLHPDHYDDKIGDETWCGKFRPDLLFQHEKIRESWPAPLRIVELLEGAGGERNSASASFDLFDIADLGFDTLRKLKLLLSNPATKELVRRLEREVERMAPYRVEHDWTAEELEEHKADEFPVSLELLDALNRRRNDSIQNVLGVSAEGLKTLFRRVREALQSKGRRLVLLLEDITSWEGLDDSLIDALVFNAAATGDDDGSDVCPLISVVGVTPKYYDDLQANYRQRITHEIILGRSQGGAQDVASLRDRSERTAFVARYLAAVRAGASSLSSWRDDLRADPLRPPPNPCEGCPKHATCFSIFGASDGIGLFPFTEHAIDRFFEALKVDDRGQTWRTPRGVLQAVLNPVLEQVDNIEDGGFPGDGIERSAFEDNRRSNSAPTGRLSEIISAQVESHDQARFRSLVTYWGEPDIADTSLVDEVPVFAGLPKPLVEAFSLPWIGGDAISPLETTRPHTEETLDPQVEAKPLTDVPANETRPSSIEQEKTKVAPQLQSATGKAQMTPPRRRGRTVSAREEMRQDLQRWAAGTDSRFGGQWNEELHALVKRIDSRRLGIPPNLFERIITNEMVKLEGTTKGSRDYLVIERKSWVRDGLEAKLALQYDAQLSTADRTFHLRNLSLMMRRMEAQVASYLQRRLPTADDGRLWSPISTLAQVLLARAWLRGSAEPDQPLAKQLSGILSDEPEATTGQQSRSAPWLEWLNKTNHWQSRIREDLRELVALPTEGGVRGMINSGELVSAILRMNKTGRTDAVPELSVRLPSSMGAISEAHELGTLWNAKQSQIVSVEFRQLKERTNSIEGGLRGHSVASHLERVDAAVTQASEILGNTGMDAVQAWRRAYSEYKTKSLAIEEVEDLIIAFDEEESIPSETVERLSWLANQPAGAVMILNSLMQTGEHAIETMCAHAKDVVGDGGARASLDTINAVGQAMREVSSRITAKTDAA